MDHIFLSDVHLGAFSDEQNQTLESELISLIYYCLENQIQIHVLGDLFDYWMEYPTYLPKIGQPLLRAFKNYNHQFSPSTYILGNHDNWTRGYFSKLGFEVKPDYHEITLDENQLFLHHGDGLTQKEFQLQRPLFHKMLRSNWFTNLYQFILPAEAGIDLMKRFSEMSRESFDLRPEILNQWSELFLKNFNFDVVIFGHDHIPRIETFSDGTYINPGAFFAHQTVIYYTNRAFNIVRWNSNENQFIPFKYTFEKDTNL